MKFDKSKILTSVTADQANGGDWGWFADAVSGMKRTVQEKQPLRLAHIGGEDKVARFFSERCNLGWYLFYPAPYYIQQSKWVEINNLKVGDKVKITKEWTKGERGFGFSRDLYILVGYVFEVSEIWRTFIKVKVERTFEDYTYIEVPYFVLEKVKEAVPPHCGGSGPTYAELQAKWVGGNRLQVGDKVRVTKSWEYNERGFRMPYVTHYLGAVGSVIGINDDNINIQAEKFQARVPYFAIEKVEEELEPKYRPFASAEEFALYRDVWFRTKEGGDSFTRKVEEYCYDGVKIRGQHLKYICFLDKYVFADTGEPAGVKL